MAVIRFPAAMKYYFDNQSQITVSAATVSALIEVLIEQFPSAKFHLVDSEGRLRRHFNVFVNGEQIRELNGMETPLGEDDRVILMASAAGG